jgi:Domain of unknown function (DUF4177)
MLTDPSAPQMWEYTIVHTDHLNGPSGPQLAPMWRRKYADGSTEWDQINKLGEDGWEMVNAFPVEGSGTLQYLAFVFKRPKRQRGTPVDAAPGAIGEPDSAPQAETPTDEPTSSPDQSGPASSASAE